MSIINVMILLMLLTIVISVSISYFLARGYADSVLAKAQQRGQTVKIVNTTGNQYVNASAPAGVPETEETYEIRFVCAWKRFSSVDWIMSLDGREDKEICPSRVGKSLVLFSVNRFRFSGGKHTIQMIPKFRTDVQTHQLDLDVQGDTTLFFYETDHGWKSETYVGNGCCVSILSKKPITYVVLDGKVYPVFGGKDCFQTILPEGEHKLTVRDKTGKAVIRDGLTLDADR